MKWYVYLISCGIIVPLVSCLPCCIGKPKHILWAPLLNFVLFILVDALFYPFHLEDIFSNNIDFTTGYWFWFFVPMQMLASFIITVVVFAVKMWESKRRNEADTH